MPVKKQLCYTPGLFFSQQRALSLITSKYGHMTSNNETVSRQNLWEGNIANSMTSEGNSALHSKV